MNQRELATRISDMERVLGQYSSPMLGSHYRATLPTGKSIRLLISLQGQDKINFSALNAIAHSEIGISSFELRSSYLPLFQDWGFVNVYDDYIEENIGTRDQILDRASDFWHSLDPHPVERLSINVFDMTARLPQTQDVTQTILDQYSGTECDSCLSHLRGSGLLDEFSYKDTAWFYSPEIFGENFEKVISYLSAQAEETRKKINELIGTVTEDQGIPLNALTSKYGEKMPNQVSGVGILYGYPLHIGDSSNTFYFTPDLRSRFEREGRGDKFEIIKPGVAHFQYAHKLAPSRTGRLKLNPSVLIDRLLTRGFAGDATAIGTDYELLVKKGLVKIESTGGNRYRFLLPDSREKIADLEAIRDAFDTKQIVPKIDFSSLGIQGKITTQDSLVYRSTNLIQSRKLAQQFAKEVFKL